MRVAITIALLATLATAQRIKFANISPDQQFGWATVTVPHSASPAEFMTFGDQRWPVVRGKEVGTHGWEMLVWLGMIGGKATVEGDLFPWPAPVDEEAVDASTNPFDFALSPWVRMGKIQPRVIWKVGEESHVPKVNVLGIVESNAARQVWRLRSVPWKGLVWEGWAYVYSVTERVDWEWTLTWSDRSPEYAIDGVSAMITWDHEVQIDFAKRIGVREQKWMQNGKWITNLLYNTRMGDAEQYKYRASMYCTDPGSTFDPWRAFRLANLAAARKGPVRGVCLDWDGKWLAFGVTPDVPNQYTSADNTHAAFMASMAGSGSMFDLRPLGTLKLAGSAGEQADFGASKGGYAVTLGDPRRIWELEFNDHGYFRGFHHRELDGSMLTHAKHTNWQTWSQYSDHRLGGDMLGKPPRPWEFRFGVSRYNGWDDQHRSQNYELALYALRPSYMLEQAFLDSIETDLAQMGPLRDGAPRAQGRLQMCWANWYLLLTGDAREKVLKNMDRRLFNAARDWDGKGLTDEQVRVIDGRVNDKRVLEGVDAWMPWQENIACMGYYAGWLVTGDRAYREMALALARTITRWAIFEEEGKWHVCTGVPWNEGEPLPESFYRKNNPGLLISNGFAPWTVPACVIYLELSPTDGPISVRAREILQYFYGNGYKSWTHSSWMAVR